MKKPIYPCLWFDGNAKEAAEFYCSIFENSCITDENPIVVGFNLNGNHFIVINGGPHFKINEAVSFVVECETQDEIDYYWDKLTEGGEESMCGWLKDKFGVSWQVVPTILNELMSNPEYTSKVTEAFLKMKKFNIEMLMESVK